MLRTEAKHVEAALLLLSAGLFFAVRLFLLQMVLGKRLSFLIVCGLLRCVCVAGASVGFLWGLGAPFHEDVTLLLLTLLVFVMDIVSVVLIPTAMIVLGLLRPLAVVVWCTWLTINVTDLVSTQEQSLVYTFVGFVLLLEICEVTTAWYRHKTRSKKPRLTREHLSRANARLLASRLVHFFRREGAYSAIDSDTSGSDAPESVAEAPTVRWTQGELRRRHGGGSSDGSGCGDTTTLV